MTEKFITSDTHFRHDNILKFCPDSRPFESVEEMDEVMVERWNSVVRPKDIVYHLGDVVLGGAKNLDIVGRLNGTKKLIIGNHDYVRSGMNKYLEYFDTVEAYREIGHHFIIMSHYPIHPSQLEDAWTESGKPRYVYNFHGHVHDKTINNPRYVNCCADDNNLTPQSIDDMIEMAKRRMIEVK